jgi:HEAT repeat protein
MAHSRMTVDDPAQAAADLQFLIDCLEDDDRAVRLAAAEALERLLSRKLAFNPDLPAAQREIFTDKLRAQVAKEQGKDQFPPSTPAPAPARVLRIRG